MKKQYEIEYCMYSTMGQVRRNNEDNYYVGGMYREDVTLVDDEKITGTLTNLNNDMAAVFDGMGGETCGEIASLVAARTCKEFSEHKENYEEYLYELSDALNQSVIDETANRSLVLMGTTCAMIQFSETDIYILNAGDSRIYKLSKHKFAQISEEHTAPGYRGKAPITKFLGMPVDDAPLNPYIAMGEYKVGDTYLLCTDGITDLLTDDEIKEIIDKKRPVEESVEEIIQMVNEKGAIDNATIILLKVAHSKTIKA